MAHVETVTVNGLAGRSRQIEYKLNRDINVFFGLNGSGKTSLLRILHSAMLNDSELLEDVHFESAEVTLYSADLQKSFVRKLTRKPNFQSRKSARSTLYPKYLEDTDDEDLFEFFEDDSDEGWSTRPKSHKEAGKLRLRHKFLPTWRLYGAQQIDTRSFAEIRHRGGLDWDKLFAERLKALWKSYSNVLLGTVREIQEEGFENILRGILSSQERDQNTSQLDPDEAYKKVQSFFKHRGSNRVPETEARFKSHYQENAQLRSVVRDIDLVERRIEAATEARDKLEALISRMYSGNKTLVFEDRGLSLKIDNGQILPLESLSSGEKQVLWIFLEALMIERNCLIIDEPELSLHVDWQRSLISSMHLLNPNAQLIFASHSPEIMAELDDTKIFSL